MTFSGSHGRHSKTEGTCFSRGAVLTSVLAAARRLTPLRQLRGLDDRQLHWLHGFPGVVLMEDVVSFAREDTDHGQPRVLG